VAVDRDRRAARDPGPPDGGESLPGLFARLGDDVVALVDSKLGLLKVEIKDDVAAYVQGSASLIASVGIATVGIGLVALTVAFLVAAALADTTMSAPLRYAVGTGVTGMLCLGGGGLLAKRAARNLSRVDPLPERSIAEVAKDKRWLGT
jgi:uncharacterized membrane protein YqjE